MQETYKQAGKELKCRVCWLRKDRLQVKTKPAAPSEVSKSRRTLSVLGLGHVWQWRNEKMIFSDLEQQAPVKRTITKNNKQQDFYNYKFLVLGGWQ